MIGCASAADPVVEAERVYREAADRLARGGDPAEALAALDRAAALDPRRADILVTRARLKRRLGDAAGAEADYTAALALAADPASLVERAGLRAAAGRVAEALADCTLAIRQSPGFPEARLERARLLRHEGRDADAERDLAEVRQRSPKLSELYRNAAAVEMARREHEEADRLIGFALDLDPLSPGAHSALGRLRLQQGRFGEASAAFSRAIEIAPGDARLHYDRGNARLAEGRGVEALRDYDRAIEIDPGRAEYFLVRGVARQGQADPRAESDFTEALRLEPQSAVAHLRRGLHHLERRQLEKAEEDLVKSLALEASAEGLWHLGRVQAARGAVDRAERTLRKALEICRQEELRRSIQADLDRAKERR
jgi:tetratricopeptide (TPR) repeat protein